ncbi:hypothetical protein CJJ09_003934 [Candidozyma auris]|nr:hypothetical protein CJJ09_003934 [[Candida] auris]
MADNIITQVSQDGNASMPMVDDTNGNIDYNSKIHLNIRGKEFEITRDELMSLPESILLSLFPTACFGHEWASHHQPHGGRRGGIWEAQASYNELSGTLSPQVSNTSRLDSAASILQTKPAIIVLREDLDYYVIPPVKGLSTEDYIHLKVNVGDHILSNNSVFSGLGYNPALPASVNQTLGPAEQHLFEMLCSSGFDRAELWGSRSMEPNKCVLSSLSLVRLQTQQPTPPQSPVLQPVQSNASTRSRSRSRIATLASSASRAASRSLHLHHSLNMATYEEERIGHTPWVEKYRPKKLDDVASQGHAVKVLKKTLESANLPHMLFYGPPGTGKTSTVLALAKQLYGPKLYKSRVLELNASDERGISIVRQKIKNFARLTVSNPSPEDLRDYPCPPYKIIILDEADSMTNDAQSALRRTMENYSSVTRFCLICNYITRIIDPLASRCSKFRFRALDSENALQRLQYIVNEENVPLEGDSVLEEIIKVSGGDLRKAITYLQSAARLSTSMDSKEAVTGEKSGKLSASLTKV